MTALRARSRRVMVVLVLAVVAGAALASAGVADAHRNDESYLYLDVSDSSLSGRVELPYRDMRQVLGLGLVGTSDEVLAELEEQLDGLHAYIEERTSIGDGTADWPLTFEGVETLFDEDVGENGLGYAVFPFDVELDGRSVPQRIDVTFTPFLDEIDDRNNIVLIGNDWKRGVIDQETNELVVLTQGSPSGTIDLDDASQWRNFRASVDLGVDHIRTGPDHIFFVFVLLLPSVLVLVLHRWRPTASFRHALFKVVLVATMFTIAHSLTFTLAGLDILPLPPSKLVESLIAASIAAAALYNIKPIFGQIEWVLAFAFGLFHGMGFAGLVEDLDIDRTTQLVSLLGRNLGIELGQLVIIAIAFPGLFLLRRTRLYLPAFFTVSAALAVLSGLWILERVFELDFSINGAVNRVLEWPRSLWGAAVFTVVAATYRGYEARRGRLLPVAGAGAEPATDPATDADGETGETGETSDPDEPDREPISV